MTKKKRISGRVEPAVMQCGTCVLGSPVELRAHPANLYAATWVIGEARPTSFHSNYLNATPSGSASDFVNLNQSGGENPYVHVASVNAAAPSIRSPINKICDALDSCRKRFEDAR